MRLVRTALAGVRALSWRLTSAGSTQSRPYSSGKAACMTHAQVAPTGADHAGRSGTLRRGSAPAACDAVLGAVLGVRVRHAATAEAGCRRPWQLSRRCTSGAHTLGSGRCAGTRRPDALLRDLLRRRWCRTHDTALLPANRPGLLGRGFARRAEHQRERFGGACTPSREHNGECGGVLRTLCLFVVVGR